RRTLQLPLPALQHPEMPPARRTLATTHGRQARLHMQHTFEVVQFRPYLEYSQLFGSVGRKTQLQVDNLRAELDTRKWWASRDDHEYEHREEAFIDRPRGKWSFAGPLELGPKSRILYFATLRREIKETRMTLKEVEEKASCYDQTKKEVTRRALVLFWRLRWMNRPGLEHLASQDEMTGYFVQFAEEIIDAEQPEVQDRYREIVRFIGSRLWNRLHLWDFTRDWWSWNSIRMAGQPYWDVECLENVVRDITAELVVEVVSKIGIDRALRLDHAERCDWDTTWINERLADRLMEVLDELLPKLRSGSNPPESGFGGAMGILPDEIADVAMGMFCKDGSMMGSIEQDEVEDRLYL
ncbi:MAG: hypothetical protein Q9169_005874, partial [Polycauliona sp. 2 TL-2023]